MEAELIQQRESSKTENILGTFCMELVDFANFSR